MKVIGQRTKGAFHSTKPFENLETEANGTEISRKRFKKIPETGEFPKCEPFKGKFCLEIPGEQTNGKKTFEKKIGYTSRGCTLFWNF